MTSANIKPLHYRQIHLDFHTSEHIPNVGAEFNPKTFIAALKAAHIAWSTAADGAVEVTLPGLHIHAVLVFEETVR